MATKIAGALRRLTGIPGRHPLLAAGLLAGVGILACFSGESALAPSVTPKDGTDAVASQKTTPAHIWETIRIGAGDTLGRILAARGHTSATVLQIIESGPGGKALGTLKAGTSLRVSTTTDGKLVGISYSPDPHREYSVVRNESGDYQSSVLEKQAVTASRFAEGEVTESLFAAGKRAGVSDTVILELADAFSYDIDFALDVHPGDKFRVIYEEELIDGAKVDDGNILAAEFVNQGKTYRAVRFESADGRVGYYTPDGFALRKAFLRAPVDFARISSGFMSSRYHPVLHMMRAHKGVDYAAAPGTPVKSTADGRIDFAGNKGGYGRTIIVNHGNAHTTLYAHLSGFAKNIRQGTRVSQGQVIGFIGSSGLATGPHLHYEFRIAGVHVDPLKVKTTEALPIAAADRAAFLAESARLVGMLDSYSSKTTVAQYSSGQGERKPL